MRARLGKGGRADRREARTNRVYEQWSISGASHERNRVHHYCVVGCEVHPHAVDAHRPQRGRTPQRAQLSLL